MQQVNTFYQSFICIDLFCFIVLILIIIFHEYVSDNSKIYEKKVGPISKPINQHNIPGLNYVGMEAKKTAAAAKVIYP